MIETDQPSPGVFNWAVLAAAKRLAQRRPRGM
jgi:hypothetical protein